MISAGLLERERPFVPIITVALEYGQPYIRDTGRSNFCEQRPRFCVSPLGR